MVLGDLYEVATGVVEHSGGDRAHHQLRLSHLRIVRVLDMARWMADDRRQSLLRSFAEHRDALLRFLARKLDDRSLAEDFTQETWLRAANSSGGAAIGNPRS
jgi:hypothetical protein